MVLGAIYPDEPGAFMMYALGQLFAGAVGGVPAGYFRKTKKWKASIAIPLIFLMIQIIDQYGLVPMPWNYHDPGLFPRFENQQPQDMQDQKNPKNRPQPRKGNWFEETVNFFQRNVFTFLGFMMGFFLGLIIITMKIKREHIAVRTLY